MILNVNMTQEELGFSAWRRKGWGEPIAVFSFLQGVVKKKAKLLSISC